MLMIPTLSIFGLKNVIPTNDIGFGVVVAQIHLMWSYNLVMDSTQELYIFSDMHMNQYIQGKALEPSVKMPILYVLEFGSNIPSNI